MGAKDWLVEKTAPTVLNNTLVRPYGRLTSLKFDSNTRSIELELALNGETSPILIQVTGYELLNRGDGLVLIPQRIACSRPWIQKLAEDYVVGKPWPIPPQARTIVSLLL